MFVLRTPEWVGLLEGSQEGPLIASSVYWVCVSECAVGVCVLSGLVMGVLLVMYLLSSSLAGRGSFCLSQLQTPRTFR